MQLSPLKVPNQYRTHMTFSYKIQAKTYTWPDMSFYARYRFHWCAKQRNRMIVLLGELWYTYQYLVLIYTLAFTTFSNVLLVLALNFIVHKSSYCKCSLAWCKVRSWEPFFYLQSQHTCPKERIPAPICRYWQFF